MAPRGWPGLRLWSRLTRRTSDRDRVTPDSPDPRGRWSYAAARRRLVLIGLIIGQTWLGTDFMINVLPYHGRQPVEVAILVIFAILFAWISAGFWTAVAGFALLTLGRDRHAIT